MLKDRREALLHDVGLPQFLLDLSRGGPAAQALNESRLERAIGVIYKPGTELQSHYFFAQLSPQFDAVIHCDVSRSVEPLERLAPIPAEELPETYPWGV